MSAKDPYDDLRRALKAQAQASELVDVVDQALSLKAEIPALEKRKTALATEIEAARTASAEALAKARQIEAEVNGALADLKAMRDAEQRGLEADRADRTRAADERNKAAVLAHAKLMDALRETRQALQDEIAALTKQRDELKRGIAASIEAASRA